MKKLSILIIFFLIIVAIFNVKSLSSSDSILYINDVAKYENSNEVTVEICMQNANSSITALTFDLKYDSSKLEYVSSKAGEDLSATFKMAENIPEESRVAIGAVSLSGFRNDGVYYTVTFNILDLSENIPVELSLTEASDDYGNDVSVQTQNGTILINSENEVEKEVSPTGQTIESFEEENLDDLESLEELIVENGNVILSGTDNFVYETEDSSVVTILSDGTIIANEDGTTNIRVKLNDEIIGNIVAEVKDGKVVKITATDEKLDFEATATTQEYKGNETREELVSSDDDNSEDVQNDINNEFNLKNSLILKIIIIILIIFILFIILKKYKSKKRGGKRCK